MLAQCIELRFRQRLRRDNIGGNLAAPLGEPGKKGVDHRRHRKQPPIAGDDREKIAHQRRQFSALRQSRHRAALLAARQDRAAHQPHQIGARGNHCPHLPQIGRDFIQRASLVGDVEQRHRIPFGQR